MQACPGLSCSRYWSRQVRRIILSLVCLLLPLLSPAAALGISVPGGTSIDNQASASFQSSSGASTANSNIVHVITQAIPGASLVIGKTASASAVNAGNPVTYTLSVTNGGSSDAAPITISIDGVTVQKILVRDVMPANTGVPALVSALPGAFVYHTAGSPLQNYLSTAPANLATVDAVAFVFDTFTAGASVNVSFKVTVAANALGIVRNTATVFFNNGVDTSVVSNEVDVTVSGPPPAISYFFDKTFSKTIHATSLGAPLWIQVAAGACNLDPSVPDTKTIILKSQLTGDTETFTATESGPNTGIFRILPAVPTRDANVNPVVAGNKIMEVLSNDQIIASLTGCGAASVSATVLIDPAGVVFDSHSNAAAPGAQVTLIDVTGAGNGGHPNAPATVFQFDGVTPAPSTVTTAADGRFQFPQVAPSTYKISVVPPANFVFPSAVPPAQLPPGRIIDPSGSYNGPFAITAASSSNVFDVPVDTSASTPIFIQKNASRSSVEMGDFVDYTIEIKNLLSVAQSNVQVNDTLPPGFMYVKGSARLNGSPISDPTGGKGPHLTFSIGTLAASADVKLAYRVLVGAGTTMGVNLNHAVAISGTSQSNTASARVLVQGGVLSDNGFIVGKVFQDCNGNRIQVRGEMGIPGIRIYLDDGTFAITDNEGRYSIYGVPGRTHILKVDMYSLPPNTQFSAISSRNAGDGGSRFIDLKFGEMQKADFAIANCTAASGGDIKQRRQKLGSQEELARAVKAQFNTQEVAKDPLQLKSMAASGLVDSSSAATAAHTNALPGAVNSTKPAAPVVPSAADVAAANAAEFAALTNELGFVDLKDREVMSFAQTSVRVKGQMGATFKLYVNAKEVSAKQVGTKTTVADKQLEIWEFVGVNLQPGKNFVEVKEVDPFGNERRSQLIELIAPNKLGKVKVEIPHNLHAADGKTPVKVIVRLTDANDVPVTVRTPITLEATNGTWLVKDLNPKEPGTQVFIEGGHAEFELMPPMEPGSSLVRASSGGVNAETKVEYVPELRPMIAAGLVEYQINFGSRGHTSVQPSLND